jgi:hypothetical protein
MLTFNLKYSLLFMLLTASGGSANSSSSIHRPRTKSQAGCSTAFKSKDVAFCSSAKQRLEDSATLQVASSQVAVRGGGDDEGGLLVRLKIGFYFALWYILNIVYNSE